MGWKWIAEKLVSAEGDVLLGVASNGLVQADENGWLKPFDFKSEPALKIAAANDMLSALEHVDCNCNDIHQHGCYMPLVQKALNKAKGV